jgi:hypothetical protein
MQQKACCVKQHGDGTYARKPQRHRKAGANEQCAGSDQKQAGDVERDIDVLLLTPLPCFLPLGLQLGVRLRRDGRT